MEPRPVSVENFKNCVVCGVRRACVPHLFADCDLARQLSCSVAKRRVARHEGLFFAGDNFEKLYAVRFGQFKLMRRDYSGIDSVVQFHMPGDLAGLEAIASGKHDFSLIALENSEVCEISYDTLTSVMVQEAGLQSRFLEKMSKDINNQYGRASILSRPLLDQRFALFLIYLGNRHGELGYSSRAFRLAMSRGDIASYLGTSIETVSRIIARFNAQRAATIMGRTVEIHDLKYLIGMLNDEPMPKMATWTSTCGS